MFNDWYVLDGKEVVKAESLEVLTEFLKDNSNKTVKQEHVGNVLVSTVFLGLDHGFYPSAKPLVFETMIFEGAHDGYQTRCCTWDEALIMHQKALDFIKANPND